MIKLIQGDCIEEMKKFDDEIIDLTVTSPPYSDIRTYNNTLVWNSEIWTQIIKNLYRITKIGGVVVWIIGDKTENGSESGDSFRQALCFKQFGFNLYDTMLYKSHKKPMNHRYAQEFEYMFIFSKGKLNTFNPIKVPCKNAGKSIGNVNFRKNTGKHDRKNENVLCGDMKTKGNIWHYKTGGNITSKDKIAFKHPAIFSEEMVKDHIISWSNENDTIFDPMMGSGTTGKVAIKLKRSFIGIEKVPEYFEICQKRIIKRRKFKLKGR